MKWSDLCAWCKGYPGQVPSPYCPNAKEHPMEDEKRGIAEGDALYVAKNEIGEGSRIVFGCCFCGASIHEDLKGIALVDSETGEFEQQWWCHLSCLLERMAQEARSAYAKEFD